jgi:hypothetical protein
VCVCVYAQLHRRAMPRERCPECVPAWCSFVLFRRLIALVCAPSVFVPVQCHARRRFHWSAGPQFASVGPANLACCSRTAFEGCRASSGTARAVPHPLVWSRVVSCHHVGTHRLVYAQAHGFIDYSLLVGVHRVSFGHGSVASLMDGVGSTASGDMATGQPIPSRHSLRRRSSSTLEALDLESGAGAFSGSRMLLSSCVELCCVVLCIVPCGARRTVWQGLLTLVRVLSLQASRVRCVTAEAFSRAPTMVQRRATR